MAEDRNTIAMSRLGHQGRWGNQLLEYLFIRIYAERHGLDYAVPPWAGQHLLDINDPPWTDPKLPEYREHLEGGPYSPPAPPVGAECAGRDYVGYCQFHTSWHAPDRDLVRSILRPSLSQARRLSLAERQLRHCGVSVGLHLRRGDYGHAIYYLVPCEWYLRLLAVLWPSYRKPLLFIATEDKAEAVEAFRDYRPVFVEDLFVDLKRELPPHFEQLAEETGTGDPRAFDFFPEWWLLSRCDVIVGPNSTFSFTAAMAASDEVRYWRSQLPTRDFQREDPWNTYPGQFWHRDQWLNVPGAWRD